MSILNGTKRCFLIFTHNNRSNVRFLHKYAIIVTVKSDSSGVLHIMKKNMFGVAFTLSAISYVLTHFLHLLLNASFLLHFLSISGLSALLFALMYLEKREMFLPLFLILFAMTISFFDDEISLAFVFWDGAATMRALISVLLVIPIVGWVLKQENYVRDTIILLKNQLKNSKILYFVIVWLTQLISFFLNFGALAVVYQIIQSFFSKQNSEAWQRFKSTAVLRGFSFSTIWVISIPSFAYSVETMDASLTQALVQGFTVAITGSIIAILFLHRFEKKHQFSFSKDIRSAISEAVRDTSENENVHRNPIEFLFLFVSLLALTLFVNSLVDVGLLTVIPVVVVVWAVAYFILKRKPKKFLQEGKTYVQKGIAPRAREISLLFAAGLFITSLTSSGLSEMLMNGLYKWTETIPGMNFLWVLPLIVLLFGFFGLGPLTVMVLIAGIVKSIHLPYPPELIVLAMTLGSSLSILISPLVIPVLFLSSVNGSSPVQNSVKQNWKFAIVLYFVVELYIQLRIL